MTIKTLLRQAQQEFQDINVAEYLLCGLANKKRAELYLDDSCVSSDLVIQFHNLLKNRKPNMPVQYLLHKASFLSLELYVDERVMIPRFETEELVIKTADRFKAQHINTTEAQRHKGTQRKNSVISEPPFLRGDINILDIGTGSGAIAIALADLFTRARVVATDVSDEALVVAKINIKRYGFEEKIGLRKIDLFPALNTSFDLIISNPPYIPEDEIENLPPSVKNYEPCLALNGGKNGFNIIKRIIEQAPNYLAPNGLLALEIDSRQAELILAISPVAQFEKDNQGLIRYAFIKNANGGVK